MVRATFDFNGPVIRNQSLNCSSRVLWILFWIMMLMWTFHSDLASYLYIHYTGPVNQAGLIPGHSTGNWQALPPSMLASMWNQSKASCRLGRSQEKEDVRHYPSNRDRGYTLPPNFPPLRQQFESVLEQHFCSAGKGKGTESAKPIAELQEAMQSDHGYLALRAVTNVTDRKVRLLATVQFGDHGHDPHVILRLKGEQVQPAPPSDAEMRSEGFNAKLSAKMAHERAQGTPILQRYMVFGHGAAASYRSPFVTPFSLDATNPGRRWLNASMAVSEFQRAIAHTTNMSLRGGTNGKKEKSFNDCLFFGVIQLRTSELNDETAGGSEKGSQRQRIVDGFVTSTCNLTFQFNTDERNAKDFDRRLFSLEATLLLALPFGFAAYVMQLSTMRDSRSRTLRYSFFGHLWLLQFDITTTLMCMALSMAFSVSPKLLLTTALLSSVVCGVYSGRLYNKLLSAFRVHPESYSRVMQWWMKRPFLAVYCTSFLCISLAVEFGGQVMRTTLGCLVVYSFFLPQLWHGITEGDKNVIDVPYIWCMAVYRLAPLWYFHFSGNHAFGRFDSNPFAAVVTTAWVVVQATLVTLQANKGSRSLIPAFLRPKKYSYAALQPAHLAALAEDPECTICQMPILENPTSSSPSPGADAVAESGGGDSAPPTDTTPNEDLGVPWVTPCNHFFHSECLLGWMEERPECPICRTKLPKP